jgi:hypothetical protein
MNKVIYLHTTSNGVPFYIGKGTLARAHNAVNRSKRWHEVSKQSGFNVTILEDKLTNAQANEREKFFIREYRNKYPTSMVNISDGGEMGPSVGVRLLFNSVHGYMVLRGRAEVEQLGFEYSDLRKACLHEMRMVSSKKLMYDGKRIKFHGKFFSTMNECQSFIDEHRLIPFHQESSPKLAVIKDFSDKSPVFVADIGRRKLFVFPVYDWSYLQVSDGRSSIIEFYSLLNLEACNVTDNSIHTGIPDERYILSQVGSRLNRIEMEVKQVNSDEVSLLIKCFI